MNWHQKKKIWFIEKEKLPFYLTSFHSVGFWGWGGGGGGGGGASAPDPLFSFHIFSV